jgi:hypothetical protein
MLIDDLRNCIYKVEGIVSYALCEPNHENDPIVILLGDYHQPEKRCESCIPEEKCATFYLDKKMHKVLNTLDTVCNTHISKALLYVEGWFTSKEAIVKIVDASNNSSSLALTMKEGKDCYPELSHHNETPNCSYSTISFMRCDVRFRDNTHMLFTKLATYNYELFVKHIEVNFKPFSVMDVLLLMKQRIEEGMLAFLETFTTHSFFKTHSFLRQNLMKLEALGWNILSFITLYCSYYKDGLDAFGSENKAFLAYYEANKPNEEIEYKSAQDLYIQIQSILSKDNIRGWIFDTVLPDIYFLIQCLTHHTKQTPQTTPLYLFYAGHLHIAQMTHFLVSTSNFSSLYRVGFSPNLKQNCCIVEEPKQAFHRLMNLEKKSVFLQKCLFPTFYTIMTSEKYISNKKDLIIFREYLQTMSKRSQLFKMDTRKLYLRPKKTWFLEHLLTLKPTLLDDILMDPFSMNSLLRYDTIVTRFLHKCIPFSCENLHAIVDGYTNNTVSKDVLRRAFKQDYICDGLKQYYYLFEDMDWKDLLLTRILKSVSSHGKDFSYIVLADHIAFFVAVDKENRNRNTISVVLLTLLKVITFSWTRNMKQTMTEYFSRQTKETQELFYEAIIRKKPIIDTIDEDCFHKYNNWTIKNALEDFISEEEEDYDIEPTLPYSVHETMFIDENGKLFY